MKTWWLALMTVALASCSTTEQKQVIDAASAPLQDLNLVKPKIPEALLEAERLGFSTPTDVSCSALYASMAKLDLAGGRNGTNGNGSDGKKDDPDLIEKGKEELSKAAIDTVQGTAEAVLPYRKWVRKLTGAEKRSEALADALAAGFARRTFLSGYALAAGCDVALIKEPTKAVEVASAKAVGSHDLASVPMWLVGRWCMQVGDERTEELWLPASNGPAIGISRTLNRDAVTAFEYMRISKSGDQWQYLAQPGGAHATSFTLIEQTANSLQFENPQHDFPTRIRYQRDGERLLAEIAGPGKDGNEKRIAYAYQACAE